jgi:hypothetical protein
VCEVHPHVRGCCVGVVNLTFSLKLLLDQNLIVIYHTSYDNFKNYINFEMTQK